MNRNGSCSTQLASASTSQSELDEEYLTKSRWDTNDDARARAKLSCEVDLLVWCSLDELNAWNGISDLDHNCDCVN